MGKIRDWFIHMLGGTTDCEYNTIVNANSILVKAFTEERNAKQHAIIEARQWKKQYNKLLSKIKDNKLLSKINDDAVLLKQTIVKLDGMPDKYIEEQICMKFAKELLPYIKFTKEAVAEPNFCKQETTVQAFLKVVKPDERRCYNDK